MKERREITEPAKDLYFSKILGKPEFCAKAKIHNYDGQVVFFTNYDSSLKKQLEQYRLLIFNSQMFRLKHIYTLGKKNVVVAEEFFINE